MGYLLHLNYKNNNLIVLLASILIFTVIYYMLGDQHFNVKITHKLDLFDSVYLSIVTQSLLGPGDINPKSDIARFFLMLQVLITMFVTFMYVKS